MDKETVNKLLATSPYANNNTMPPSSQFSEAVSTILENANGLTNGEMLLLYGTWLI
jgi:hypothetical protein